MKKNIGGKCPALPIPKIDLRMKLTALLVTISLFQIQANTYSQNTKLTLNMRDASLGQVFDQIESVSEFRFLFESNQIDLDRKVTVIVKKKRISQVLDVLFQGTDIQYTTRDRQVLLTKKKVSLEEESTPVAPKTKKLQFSVSGTVTDTNGTPLPGASVIEKGTTNGTQTDFDGNFTLEVDDSNAILVVSYIGFAVQEVPLNGQTVISVALQEDTAQLDEVVITGYTSQSKRSITGSVATADVEELKRNPATSVEQALQGNVAGVNVKASGNPNGSVQVRIRGFSSDRNNEPLYIIDGTPTGSGLNDINPDDIESISVLKDASAASIYGARASNGVIVITTKKGRRGQKAKVSYNGFSGFEFVNNLPEFLNVQQWAQSEWDGRIAAGLDPSHPQLGSGASPVIPDFISPVAGFEGDPGTTIDDYNRESIDGLVTRSGDTDWLDEVYNTAFVQNHNISIVGGGENSNYGLSFGFLDREGVAIHTEFQRYTTRANSQFYLFKDKVRIGENLSVTYSERKGNGGVDQVAYRFNPLIPVRDIAGNFAGTHNGALGLGTNFNNPVATQFNSRNNINRRLRVLGNLYAEADLMPGLTAKTNIAVDYINSSFTAFTPTFLEGNNQVNTLDENFSYSTSLTWTNTLQYTKRFAEDHSIDVLAGTEAIENRFRFTNAEGSGYFLTDPSFTTISTSGNPATVRGSFSERRLFSLFGKVDYGFKDRYFVNGTIRRDGSSALGPNNTNDVFVAFGAGWVISDEAFVQDLDFLNYLKLSGGWGQAGNQNSLGNFDFAAEFSSDPRNTSVDINNTQNTITEGFALLSRGNPDLVWETSETTNVRLDFGLFNNAFTGNVEWYDIRTKDLLTRDQLPLAAGAADAPFINIGDIKNTGWDITLNYRGNITEDLGFGVTAIVNTYKNEVISFGPEFRQGGGGNPPLVATRTEAGRPLSQFYGFIVDGILQEDRDLNGDGEIVATERAGNFNFRDLNEDGVLNGEDFDFIGDPHPDFTYSLNLSLDYKNFDFSALFRGSQGNDIYHWGKVFTDFFFRAGLNRSTRILDAWRPDNTGSGLAQYNVLTADFNSQSSSYYVEDGSFFRLQTLQLGYTFKELIGLERFRVYLQGQNLFTISNYTGIDPEIQEASAVEIGVDRDTTFPVPTSVLLGFNINF